MPGKAILRELNRYPHPAIRLSQPLPVDSWGRPEPRAVLPPAEDSRHPYRVEVALPPWVLDGDPALRHWLFSYGGAIRLEAPQALVEEPRQWLKDALAALRRPLGASGATVVDGPEAAPVTVLLAHGVGWRVVHFEFPSMARMRETGRRQGSDRMPVLQEAFRQQMQLEKTEQSGRPIFIGGKSMGGRVASLLVDELAASDGVRGFLCLGYPFHPPGPSGHGRRWRAMRSQPKFSWSGSPAATTALRVR